MSKAAKGAPPELLDGHVVVARWVSCLDDLDEDMRIAIVAKLCPSGLLCMSHVSKCWSGLSRPFVKGVNLAFFCGADTSDAALTLGCVVLQPYERGREYREFLLSWELRKYYTPRNGRAKAKCVADSVAEVFGFDVLFKCDRHVRAERQVRRTRKAAAENWIEKKQPLGSQVNSWREACAFLTRLQEHVHALYPREPWRMSGLETRVLWAGLAFRVFPTGGSAAELKAHAKRARRIVERLGFAGVAE